MNPFIALYKGEKVFAIVSKLRARQVKNLATNTHSVSACFSINQTLEPSQSERVSLLHDFVGSSICNEAKKTENEKEMRYRNNKEGIWMEGKKGKEGSVSQWPKKKTPQASKWTYHLEVWKTPLENGLLFYTLGEGGAPPFASERESF